MTTGSDGAVSAPVLEEDGEANDGCAAEVSAPRSRANGHIPATSVQESRSHDGSHPAMPSPLTFQIIRLQNTVLELRSVLKPFELECQM